jgi:hypothetical protein
VVKRYQELGSGIAVGKNIEHYLISAFRCETGRIVFEDDVRQWTASGMAIALVIQSHSRSLHGISTLYYIAGYHNLNITEIC